MNITINPHTIILLIGPSNCGKSYFFSNVLKPQLDSYKYDYGINNYFSYNYISSDKLRKDILGKEEVETNKYSEDMMYASEGAFNMLREKLKACTSYPVNNEVVVVDTTALNEDFRKEIKEIAKENHYNLVGVVFNYKNRDDYFQYCNNTTSITKKGVNRLKKDELSKITKKTFDEIFEIKENNFDNIKLYINNFYYYKQCFLNSTLNISNYCIVGDIHGCFKTFKALLEKNEFEIKRNYILNKEKKVILVGDYLDKGSDRDVRNMINFIYKNLDKINIVIGNHEEFIYKRLIGEYNKENIPDIEETTQNNFSNYYLIANDEKLFKKFIKIYSRSKPFLKYKQFKGGSGTGETIITHAPCSKKYLGKIDKKSYKNQIKFRYDNSTFENFEKSTKFIFDEANWQHPIHIFGHINVDNVFTFKNKINIDTGAVFGNFLSSISINPVNKTKNSIKKQDFIDTFKPKEDDSKPLNKIKSKLLREQSTKSFDDLSNKERARIFSMLENKVNFVASTISPADKDIENNEFESMKKAMEYYYNNGITKISIQPKYMGSRANLYLDKDNLEECYLISRNGFKINKTGENEEINNLLKNLQQKYKFLFEKYNSKKIIIDGELMPRKLLGENLIENTFKIIEKSIEKEIKMLDESGFDEVINYTKNKLEKEIDKNEFSKLSKKELLKKYNQQTIRTFNNLLEYSNNHYTLDKHKEGLETFKKQLDIYGNDDKIDFKPFDMLKFIKEDGTEYIPTDIPNTFKFSFLNKMDNNGYVHNLSLDISDVEFEKSLEKANNLFNELVSKRKMEGVVVKPEIYDFNIAPAIKVRNYDYLKLVYGYDFDMKYDLLLQKKGIGKKLRSSIKENKLGRELLEEKYDNINKENKYYTNMLIEMIFENREEEGQDPRL